LGGRSSSVGTGWNSVVRDMSPSESPSMGEVVACASNGVAGLRVRRRGTGVLADVVALRDIVDSSVERESATPRPIEVADGTRLTDRTEDRQTLRSPRTARQKAGTFPLLCRHKKSAGIDDGRCAPRSFELSNSAAGFAAALGSCDLALDPVNRCTSILSKSLLEKEALATTNQVSTGQMGRPLATVELC
jgi:hypothetical protein